MGDCKEWDSTDSSFYETDADGPLIKMERKKQQPSVGTEDTDDNTTRDMSRVQVVEEEEKHKNKPTFVALADSEEVSEDKGSEDGQIAAKAKEEERGSLRVSREEELVRRLERLELEVRSQRARYSAGAGAGRGQEQRPSMGQSDGSRRDEKFRDRARAVM